MRAPSEVVRTIKCAVCGTMKQKSNNWWEVKFYDNLGVRYLTLGSMPKDYVEDGESYYLCGTACVTKIINEHMDEQINERNKAEGEFKNAWEGSANAAKESC